MEENNKIEKSWNNIEKREIFGINYDPQIVKLIIIDEGGSFCS